MSASGALGDFDLDLALEGLAIRGDPLEMECVIKCLGEQIQKTKASIHDEWQSFAEQAQLSLDTDFSSIRDIPGFFQDQVQMEKHSCTTESINLNVFLNNVVQALERNLGQEEKILDELTNFAAAQGLVLPAPFPKSGGSIYSSTASLNVVISEVEETTNALWERIRKMVSRALLATVDKLGLAQDKDDTEALVKKVKLLEKMCTLYLPCDVWKMYLVLRSQQIEQCFKNPRNLDSFELAPVQCSPEENTLVEIESLGWASRALDRVLCEDYGIVELGMFPEAFQMEPEEIFNVYLSGFKNKLGDIVKNLHTLGRRGSVKLGDNSSNTLSSEVFLGLRQCVLAASSADMSARKFLSSLQFGKDKREILHSNFGSTFSLPSTPADTGDTNEDAPVPKVVRDEPEVSQPDIWCWQEEFKLCVTKLALAIAENIQSTTRTALDQEMEEYEICHNYEAAAVAEKLVNGILDYPKQVAKSCALIIAKTDEMSSFLLLRPGKEFEPVRTLFIESLSTVLTAYHSRLSRISSEVPRRSPIKSLYLTFNSAIYIHHTLKRYENEYGEITGSLSAVYRDLIKSLYEKIISYHYTTIATVILQDVQSHHWMNHREFFEGERCSFSLQMWNYYMEGLRHDLWEMCPPVRAQAIFTAVLQYSLAYFVRRYSKAIPTYRRTKLFRSDITALLFSMSSSMLFYVSSSWTDIFNPDPTRNAVTEIHNSCSALLAMMTVVSCPLETICVFSSGGAEGLISDEKSTVTSWVGWLRPELFGEHSRSLLSVSDIQAVNIHFKLMISQPQPIWKLVLQTVLLRDAYLAVTIVTYLENYHIHLHDEDERGSPSKRNGVQFRSPCVLSTDDKQDEYSSGIVGSLYYVILKCCNRSKPMVNFIIALINRENSWQIFASAKGLKLGKEDKIPVWLDCIYSTFKPFISRLTDIVVSGLCSRDQSTSKPSKFTSVNSLPCGCQVNKQTPSGKPKDKTSKELIFQAFERVLKSLVSSLRLLPRILFKVFNRIEDDLRQLKLTSENTSSAGLKILGSMLFRGLSSSCADDRSCAEGTNCDGDIRKDCMHLAQLVYHVMAGDIEGFYGEVGLPIALETLITSKREWIDDQVRKIGDIISEMNDDDSVDESAQDHFLALQYGLRVKQLFHDNKGEKALKQAYNFFQSKKDWIIRRIPLVSHLGSLQQTPATAHGESSFSHSSSLSSFPSSSFNPLQVYNSLGDYDFDHNAVESFPFDWEQLFQSNIGMTLKSFKRLVYNRYELQSESDVDEDKKELIAKLKAFYDPENEVV